MWKDPHANLPRKPAELARATRSACHQGNQLFSQREPPRSSRVGGSRRVTWQQPRRVHSLSSAWVLLSPPPLDKNGDEAACLMSLQQSHVLGGWKKLLEVALKWGVMLLNWKNPWWWLCVLAEECKFFDLPPLHIHYGTIRSDLLTPIAHWTFVQISSSPLFES